jgi:broad specificity phosphatase PhoE
VSKLRLFVVRHGETAWSRERRFAGHRDVPLGEEGACQFQAVARHFQDVPLAAVYASPLERARASAELVAKPHRLEVRVDPDVREMGFGPWEGLTRDEVAARFPEAWARWGEAPHRLALEGMEALGAVGARARAAVARLQAAHAGQAVALVTHAIVSRLVVLEALGLGPERLWTVDASPAGITEIEYEPGWATVHRMNDLSHLGARP